MIHLSNSAPLDSLSPKVVMKRSPISITFDLLQNDHEATSHHPELLALSTGPIKTGGAILRGPSVSGSAVINLVEHEIVQTHDHPGKVHVAEDVIATLSDIHAVSSSRKTTVTTKVGHIADEKGITSVVTHDISHTHETVAHVTEDDAHLRVLPLHAVVISNHQPQNLVAIHTTKEPKTSQSEETRERRGKHNARNIYREAIGGYGIGWRIGGHGAGHGFYVNL